MFDYMVIVVSTQTQFEFNAQGHRPGTHSR